IGEPVLTVEFNPRIDAVEIFCDGEGLDLLLDKLTRLKKNGGHTHLMTPTWAGDELSETRQGPDNRLLNHLVIALAPEEGGR
ncbi:MAG TPA: Imm32 family immunity protein, partial [Longimicrobium sp.]|nr:Imm32 family immunity protein [Longimicrobium sp.]